MFCRSGHGHKIVATRPLPGPGFTLYARGTDGAWREASRGTEPDAPVSVTHLLIINRRDPGLFSYVLRSFANVSQVLVLLDRRVAQRRQGDTGVWGGPERRRAERRHDNREATYQLRTIGHVLARVGGTPTAGRGVGR